MFRKCKDYLVQDCSGFSGANHVLIAIGLFLGLLLIPVQPFTLFIKTMTASPLFAIITFFLVIGGALLPDIDNAKSKGGSAASWDLGIIGSILSVGMITISSLFTSIFHLKKDVKPFTQHRFFWHTLLVPIGLFLLIYYFIPQTKMTLWKSFESQNGNLGVVLVSFLVGISIYAGSIFFLKKLAKFTPLKSKYAELIAVGLTILTIFVCLTFPFYQVKLLGYTVCLGYLFHIIGDAFADSGIPAFFPIPLFGKFWRRICLLGPFSITTGSIIESMCKFVFLSIDIVLAYLVFSQATGFSLFG